ncbi:MAG TPA: GAF domain-containing SpoIIE family protein phosphatase [Candidatus Limnocylindrales bacterium]|nr:GAF domain-containing SpoIIE family protein phosphatase [Candidatus Limnocylindrales bacterium]
MTSRDRHTLSRIRAVTDASLSNLEVDELLRTLLERVSALLRADTATILLMDPSGRELITAATVGLEEELELDVRVPVGAGFSGQIAQTGQPLVVEHVERHDVFSRVLLDRHLTSLAGVPIVAGGGVVGVLRVGTTERRSFGEEDIELLRIAADRAAVATQARLSQLERATTLALQRSLLPARPPFVAGLDVAVRYIPGAQVGVGGDWYDVFQLPTGHVGLAIGDVAGNGLRAAVVMGRVRSALRAYALDTTDPAEVLTRLDRKIQLFEPDALVTAVYGVVNPEQTAVTLSVAGHPMPVALDTVGGGQLVKAPVDLPLGAVAGAPRGGFTLDLVPGSGLLMYTDGLVERRYQPLDEGIGKLLAGLTNDGAEVLCANITSSLLHNAAGTDDVAVLAVRVSAG